MDRTKAPHRRARINAARGFLFASLATLMTTSVAHSQSAYGWIELKPVPGRNLLEITGRVLSPIPVNGAAFTLNIRRTNGGNVSTTKQAGGFDLSPNEDRALSSTSLNVEAGDELTIELKISANGKEVSRALLSIKGDDRSQKI
ncbi:hypothetical protein Rvan_2071 [Rhodomicrobium vannielii ATCC 17100]|uniref:Uncharacterized protein n=1 Tax=Rhodomicrobium vannielii (strain ATCC 17100 / DSM 162 / LMG 4299 / NCIMB 10020 / ATH 3.1.1) TaxID=648757 RepID=E3I1Z7_RHOVT|nr:curli-like amyloid fiber formation chaperone CsgH [Rhodomicrobium vannielii]ADP71298.1 hypothetical protein Rvan_2071 [Rhodomicrobium vannielii ATCC 17100]